MHNITLICTRHDEKGLCNIEALHKIIKSVNPDVIFEEIPPSFFDEYYKFKTKHNLETDAINMYLGNHNIEHIPVDHYDIPKLFFEDNRYMHHQVELCSPEYRRLVDTNSLYAAQHGFKYLNSTHCSNIYSEINRVIAHYIKMINNDKLNAIHESWNAVIEKRESVMIDNIYKYCKEHSFNTGLFFIGAGHRESIINKIEIPVKTENVKTNWNYSNYESVC
jgi:hypothetical protein